MKITFVTPSGTRIDVQAAAGTTIMQVALDNNVDGVIGECGGNQVCATCHVYIEAARLADIAPVSTTEDALLDAVAAERRGNSRLGCQINLTEALDNLSVFLPEKQH